jgi:uncharacterized membrane protein
MEARPKIQIELTRPDKIIETAGYLAIIILWVLAIFNYLSLPEIIPIHFNASGLPDGYANRRMIFFLPLIGTILFAGMTVLNKFPHIFNFPVKITAENVLTQYTNATRLIRLLKLVIALVFSVIILFTGLTATGKISGLGAWFLPIVIALIQIPIVYYLVKTISKKLI